MPKANFRFFGRLNDLIRKEWRNKNFEYEFIGNPSIKHIIEAIGVPHPEVGRVTANSQDIDFSYLLKEGDHITVFPSYQNSTESINLTVWQKNEIPNFLLDNHLGKLATYLRMLGFDVLYAGDSDDEMLADISYNQDRILLTRDRGLLKRKQVRYGHCLMSKSPKNQVLEVLQRFNIADKAQLFSRCARCNGALISVEKKEIIDRIEPKTKQYYDEFHICQLCDQIYWKGSHFDRMESQLQSLLRSSRFG